MKWIKFDMTCPQNVRMLFYEKKHDKWYDGTFVLDQEYGPCICAWESYISLDSITHYMVVETQSAT